MREENDTVEKYRERREARWEERREEERGRKQ